MLKENLNIECNLRIVQISSVVRRAAAGNFDLAISAIVSTLMDPSDYFTAWYGKDGPQNYSGWNNEQFQRPLAADRARGRRQQAQGDDPPGRGRSWSRIRR